MKTFSLFVFIFASAVCTLVAGDTTEERTTLVKSLFQDYAKDVTPGKPTVYVSMNLHKLNVLESESSILLDVGFIYSWYDSRLTWNPSSNGGINSLILPQERIWNPDIAVANAPLPLLLRKPAKCQQTDAIIYSNGTVQVVENICADLVVSCPNLTLSAYPLASQSCTLMVGSWSQDVTRMDWQLGSPVWGGFGMFYDVTSWKLLGVDANRQVEPFFCCPTPFANYPIINFNVNFQRKAASSCPEKIVKTF